MLDLLLEWTDDEYGRFEGTCDMLLLDAAAQKIAERGDATVLVEYSPDGSAYS